MLTYCGRIAGESIDLLWENSRKKCSEILTSWQLSVYHFNWRICLPSFLSFINWRLGPGTASVHRGCPSWGHKTLHIRLRMHLEAWPTGLDFSASAVRTPRQFWLICAFSTLSLLTLCLSVLHGCHIHFCSVLKFLVPIHHFPGLTWASSWYLTW